MSGKRYYYYFICSNSLCGFEINGPVNEININGVKIYTSPEDGNILATLASTLQCPHCGSRLLVSRELISEAPENTAHEIQEIEIIG